MRTVFYLGLLFSRPCFGSYLSRLLFHHILSHLEGTQVLIHVLNLCVFSGILAAVKKFGDGIVIIVDHVALLAIFVVTYKWQQRTRYLKNGIDLILTEIN